MSGSFDSVRWNAYLGSISAFTMDLLIRLSHTGDLKSGTPVANLPGAWRYRFSVETSWSRVSIPWDSNFDLLLLSQCGSTYNCLSRSVSEIH